MAETKLIHSSSAVPLEERTGPLTMGLLWITMVTFFPGLLIGFEWHKNGFTLTQVIICTIISCLILLAFSIPSTQLGAQTGLGFTVLSRGVFGRIGSQLVTINLICIFTLFYGVTGLFMADSVNGLFHLKIPLSLMAAGFAMMMSINNFFGFKGIANFARYVAAPLLIIWVIYSFFKATNACPSSAVFESPHKPLASALTTVSTFVIGNAVWGNEKDYWRFSIPKPLYAVIPLTVALTIGQIIFPVTGWMVAHMTGITEYSVATEYMTHYSFGGNPWIAVLILGASYFAACDSNLFASIQACETLKDLPHRIWVIIMATAGAITAFLLSISGTAKSLDAIVALNCVIMPTPTVIMLIEWFLLAKVFRTARTSINEVLHLKQLPLIRWPAVTALISGLGVGLATSGSIPGLEFMHVGICSLQAWLTALIVYVPLRIIEHNQIVAHHTTILERVLAKRFEQASARLPIEKFTELESA